MSKTVLEYFGMNAVTAHDCSKDFPVFPMNLESVESEIAVGIEVEIENYQLIKQPNTNIWFAKGDGSLRNNGIEYVSTPIQAKWAPAALDNLLSAALDKSCCFSPRTSIHVHLDMQKVESHQVIDIVLLYTMLEGLFYKFTGRGRIKNIYCVPIFDTGLLAGSANRNLAAMIEQWSKYTGLNLIPLKTFGTLEFRHMHGTFDVQKVSIWIRLLTKLVDFVLKSGTNDIRKLLTGSIRDIQFPSLLRQIFGDDDQYMKYESYADVAKGVDAVKTSFVEGKATSEIMKAMVNGKGLYFTTKGVK
jgi:Putative amidoligase enzyme